MVVSSCLLTVRFEGRSSGTEDLIGVEQVGGDDRAVWERARSDEKKREEELRSGGTHQEWSICRFTR